MKDRMRTSERAERFRRKMNPPKRYSRAWFASLRSMNRADLLREGMRAFDRSGLLLFPAIWFEFIPVGYEVVTVFGEVRNFVRKRGDSDSRFGMLSFGIVNKEARRRGSN